MMCMAFRLYFSLICVHSVSSILLFFICALVTQPMCPWVKKTGMTAMVIGKAV